MPVRLDAIAVRSTVDLPTGRVRSGVADVVRGKSMSTGIVRRHGAS